MDDYQKKQEAIKNVREILEKTPQESSEEIERREKYKKIFGKEAEVEKEYRDNNNDKKATTESIQKKLKKSAKENNKKKKEIRKLKIKKKIIKLTIELIIAISVLHTGTTTIETLVKFVIEKMDQRSEIKSGIKKLQEHHKNILALDMYSINDSPGSINAMKEIKDEEGRVIGAEVVDFNDYINEVNFRAGAANLSRAEKYLIIKNNYNNKVAEIICGKISQEELDEAAIEANERLSENDKFYLSGKGK